MHTMSKDKTIVYVAGSINADHVYECWQSNQEDQSYFGNRPLLEFYNACRDLSLKPHVIAPTRTAKYPRNSKYTHIDYWQLNSKKYKGALYHISECMMILRVILRAVQLRASAIVITQGRPYWFLLNLANLFGMQVIPSIHCVLWPKLTSPKRAKKVLYSLTANFFKLGCPAIMAMSDDIEVQVREITQNKCRPIIKFLPVYTQDLFQGVEEQEKTGFKILFAGRIEANKGVFGLLEIAIQLRAEDKVNITFDICGIGSALEDLRRKVQELGLEKSFRCHGFCDKPQLKAYYVNCDVVIVPTRTDFIEGFNMVCSEAILASKPVITSEVCPAVAEIRSAALIVLPDDIEAYKVAILELYSNKALYEQKKAATYKLKEKFLDPQNGWGEKFKKVVLNYTNLASHHVPSVE